MIGQGVPDHRSPLCEVSVRGSTTIRRRHLVDEMLPAGKLAVYGFQHVLALYAGAVIVPILREGRARMENSQTREQLSAVIEIAKVANPIHTARMWGNR